MVRKPFVLMALATSLVLAVFAFNASARANGEASFSLRGFSFDQAPAYQSPIHEWVLKWRVTVCTPRAAKIRVRPITRQPITEMTARSRFVRHQPVGCTQHRFKVFNDNFLDSRAVFSRLRMAWRDQHLRTKWKADIEYEPGAP
jgi:hypothetical protein